MVQFLEGRNRAWAQLDAPINGSDTNVALVAGQGSRLSDVTTASGRKVRAQIYERDTDTGAITKCELVDITNNVSDVLIIERAVESTRATDTTNTYAATPQSFTANAIIEEVISSEVLSELQDEVNRIVDEELPLKADQADVDALINVYAAASGGTDNYAFTIPGFVSYAANAGKHYTFLSDVANAGASGVNISGLGNIPMYKQHDQNTETGDIEASQLVEIVIGPGGTYVEMVSQVAKVVDLSSYASRAENATLGEDVIVGDSVYPSAADTVKKVYPSDIQTLTASPSTSPTTNSPCKLLQISNGVVLQVSGSDGGSGGYTLKAQVRTINALETDFTFGSEATLFGSAVTWFDVCQIDTNTWIAIYNKAASGAIACVAFTISGTTITVGSEQSIETAGTTSWKCSIAKVDTLKCLITYMKNSDSKPYVQVLTVSGTSITTNTPVLLKNTGNGQKTASCQITTNQVLIVYGDTASSIYSVTVNVSGTTPTVNTETLVANIGTGSQSVEVKRVSNTKAIAVVETGTSNQIALQVLSLSGSGNNTISAGAATVITGANANNNYRGLQIVGTGYCIFSSYRTTPTDMYVRYYSIGATTTTLISTQTTAAVSSASYPSVGIAKISPWTYLVSGMAANADFIIKLTPVSTRIGIVEASASSGATVAVTMRFQKAILSGLTAGALYYVDDDAQPTTNSSLTAISLGALGVARSTTLLLLT